MSNQLERVGVIIKIIGNSPGIKLTEMKEALLTEGIEASVKTITTDIAFLKDKLKLLPASSRLRSGYFLEGVSTVGAREIGTVMDALSAFGVALGDTRALEISKRLASYRGARKDGMFDLHQRSIYKRATSEQDIEDTLFRATMEHLPVRLVIESPRNRKDLTVYPLFKRFHERGWYLIHRDVNEKRYHPCRIDRIIRCEVPKDAAVNESHKRDVEEAQILLSAGWGMDFPHTGAEVQRAKDEPAVVVRFDETAAPFIREGVERHRSGKVRETKDGSGHVEFVIRLVYYDEFKKWVRSWGPKAWFVSPDKFVNEAAGEIQRQAFNYKTKVVDS